MQTPKLIIIRGSSGSGKSTVAMRLQSEYPSPTLLICEDKIRFMFSNWVEPAHTASKELALASILSGLKSGFNVIYEGISNVKTYSKYFERIFTEHPDENYFFYLDVDFDETLKRHEMRPEKSEFGPEEMKRWRDYASPTGYKFETIISQQSSIDETVKKIIEVTNAAASFPQATS